MAGFGNSGLIPLGGAGPKAQTSIIAEAPSAKGAKPEQIYRTWLELAEARIGAEQILVGGFNLSADAAPGPGGLRAVLDFFDGLAVTLFTRQTDVGELSNYMAGDARRWRDLLRALRQRSTGAKADPRYDQLTRALAAAEFLASEPISDEERAAFSLENIRADLGEGGRSIQIAADIRGHSPARRTAPNIAICLRDANGDVCGEAVLAAAEVQGPSTAPFCAALEASGAITDVEVSFTRRAAA